MTINRRLTGLGDAVLVGKNVRLRPWSWFVRILRERQELNIPIFRVLRDKNNFVLRRKEIGKKFRLDDDGEHDQQVQDDGDPDRFTPS